MFQSFETNADRGAVRRRVAALRARFAEAEIDGFLVPRSDAHQGEVVAPHDERLSWLTGFTGSAGIAVVLADRAALFADGRYTLQAGRQTDTGIFEVVPVHQIGTAEWLEKALTPGAVLGYDLGFAMATLSVGLALGGGS